MKWITFWLILLAWVFPIDIISGILSFIVYLNFCYALILDYKEQEKK